MVQLWRIHIRPDSDPAFSYSLCLREKVIGIGWQVDHDATRQLSIDDYLKLAAEKFGDKWSNGKTAVERLTKMKLGDLVWMRSPHGVYHLCKIDGDWEYRDQPDYQKADIVNVRPVKVIEVGISTHVPGKVIACFIPSRTLQRINNDTALAYSERIWNILNGRAVPPSSQSTDLFSLISAEECEDLIFVYLQAQGWIVYPAQREPDTLAYEFALRHRQNFREAVVQVKTGWSPVELGALPSSVDVAFAFQPNGQYSGQNSKAVLISRDDILKFISENPRLIPPTVNVWVDKPAGGT